MDELPVYTLHFPSFLSGFDVAATRPDSKAPAVTPVNYTRDLIAMYGTCMLMCTVCALVSRVMLKE